MNKYNKRRILKIIKKKHWKDIAKLRDSKKNKKN